MSVDVDGDIHRTCIDEKAFDKIIVDFFAPEKELEKTHLESGVIEYEHIRDEVFNAIFFQPKNKDPYGGTDSVIYNGFFKVEQYVSFNMNKWNLCMDSFRLIIDFFIYLKNNISSEILVSSDEHGEICLLKDNTIVWSDNAKCFID